LASQGTPTHCPGYLDPFSTFYYGGVRVDKGWSKGGQWVEDAWVLPEFFQNIQCVIDSLKENHERMAKEW